MMAPRWSRGVSVLLVILLLLQGGARGMLAQDCGTDSGTGCAPDSARVDLDMPTFTDPTQITNPLFPVSAQSRVLFVGTIDRLPFRTEVTLLPDTRTIEWNGQQIEVLTSQYMAFLDGRITEVALDWYAQADDGSVWYFGEDVFNYQDGVVANRHGTWLAGRDGPPAMIMPGSPQVGDVFRPENSPGIVFEEVRVSAVDMRVHGPNGNVTGAIVTDELHMDGTHEGKIFAPGYGEYYTGVGGEMEALALAIPTDALGIPVPLELEILADGAMRFFNLAGAENWETAAAELSRMHTAWAATQAGNLPRLLDARMSWALAQLTAAVDARQAPETRQAAIDVARAAQDLLLRHKPVAEVDLALLDLWAAQVLVDAESGDAAGVLGDVATLEWVWQRIAHTVANSASLTAVLADLRTAADREDLAAATRQTRVLRETIRLVA